MNQCMYLKFIHYFYYSHDVVLGVIIGNGQAECGLVNELGNGSWLGIENSYHGFLLVWGQWVMYVGFDIVLE